MSIVGKRLRVALGRTGQLAILGLVIVGFGCGIYFLQQDFKVTSSLPPQVILSSGECNIQNQSQNVNCSLNVNFEQKGQIYVHSVNVTEFPRQVAYFPITNFSISGPAEKNLTFSFLNSQSVKVHTGTQLTIFVNFDAETLYEVVPVQG